MKKGDYISELQHDSFTGGKWTYKEQQPVKIVGEFETYFICRHPRCSPFFIQKNKAILKTKPTDGKGIG